VPNREEGTVPTTTITNYQRDGLYELVRNHLGGIGDVWTALEETEDFDTSAEWLLDEGGRGAGHPSLCRNHRH